MMFFKIVILFFVLVYLAQCFLFTMAMMGEVFKTKKEYFDSLHPLYLFRFVKSQFDKLK